MKQKPTGYSACEAMVEAIIIEIEALKALQKVRIKGESLANEVQALARSCAVLQGEIRKTVAGADDAIDKLPMERRVELIIRMIKELSPEYRGALKQYMDELGVGLQ